MKLFANHNEKKLRCQNSNKLQCKRTMVNFFFFFLSLRKTEVIRLKIFSLYLLLKLLSINKLCFPYECFFTLLVVMDRA